MNKENIEKTIAKVIVSTKRKARPYNIYEVATAIKTLKEDKGSLHEVSKIIGISTGMLNQFLSVFKLPNELIEMVKLRKIDSVTLVHNLAKLNNNDSLELIELLKNKKLTSQELRLLIPYRKRYPNESIVNLVEKLNQSKDKKISVIKIPKTKLRKTVLDFYEEVEQLIGKENLLETFSDKDFVILKMSKEGEKVLRKEAKINKLTLQKKIEQLLM